MTTRSSTKPNDDYSMSKGKTSTGVDIQREAHDSREAIIRFT